MSNKEQWQKIIDEIQAWQRPLLDWGYPVWFRGQRNAEWGADTGLHRHVKERFNILPFPVSQADQIDLLRSVYQTLYRKFKARAWRFLEPSERSAWGIVFAMQHYGLPTNLLDWTQSLACAIYFAQQGREPECDAAIYLLNPERLNLHTAKAVRELYERRGIQGKVNIGEGQIPLDENFTETNYSSFFHPQNKKFFHYAPDICRTIAVAPFHSNTRMLAQRAAFTLCGFSFLPLEEQFDSSIIKKIILPSDTYEDAQDFLGLVGINHFGYFPDITNLVKDMKEELQLEMDSLTSRVEELKHSNSNDTST